MKLWDRIAAQFAGGSTLDTVGTVSHVPDWHHAHDAHGTPHVLPDFGPEHTLGIDCFCHPVVDDETYPMPVISHNVAQ
jgi:hypothetical protein